VTSCDVRWKTTTIQTQIQTLNLLLWPAFDDEHNNGDDVPESSATGIPVEELGKGVMKLPIDHLSDCTPGHTIPADAELEQIPLANIS
jgi:hypothetical protein